MGERCPYAISGSEIRKHFGEIKYLVTKRIYCSALFKLVALDPAPGAVVVVDTHGIKRPCLKCNQNHTTCPLRDAMGELAHPIRSNESETYKSRLKAARIATKIFTFERLSLNVPWHQAADIKGVTWDNTK